MRFILGFSLTVAFSAVLTSIMVHMLAPQVKRSVDALQYITENWPR